VRGDGLLLVALAPSTPSSSVSPPAAMVLEIGQVRLRIEGQPSAVVLTQVLERVLR
jgi:transposase